MEDRHSATRTISAVMAITLLGKVMGLYRDHLLAVHYGMGMEAQRLLYRQPNPTGIL